MLHCFLLSKTLVLKIDEKITSEALDPGVRGYLDEIICQESNVNDGSSIQVSIFVIFPVSGGIPNHFRDSWPIPPQKPNIETFFSYMRCCKIVYAWNR
jgi:hypothetical protein